MVTSLPSAVLSPSASPPNTDFARASVISSTVTVLCVTAYASLYPPTTSPLMAGVSTGDFRPIVTTLSFTLLVSFVALTPDAYFVEKSGSVDKTVT